MSKLTQPKIFSQVFMFDPTLLEKANLIDPVLNCDTRLFIDPLLLSKCNTHEIQKNGYNSLRSAFDKIVRLLSASKTENDPAWKAAYKLLNLNERPETCLGYGGASINGSSRPPEVRTKVLRTAKEIIQLGEDDPEIISLMGLFEEGVGPDTISDLATNCIITALAQITETFALANNLPTKQFGEPFNCHLPINPYGKQRAVILVPRDIVRDLPLAADWSDVTQAIFEIAEIREAFNTFIGGMVQATVKDKKKALKKACLQSIDEFKEIFQSILSSSAHYDPNEDAMNYYNFRSLIQQSLDLSIVPNLLPTSKDSIGLHNVVKDIIMHFKQLVEKQNLWEMLWNGDNPKRERASQLIFYAVADCYCRANNIDISPETDMGGGPVDFKFSEGYERRLLVEIKLSKGTVEHGYKKQLEVYKNAARTHDAVFLIIDVGKMGKKLQKIQHQRDILLKSGSDASEIFVVNAKRKSSASKRQ